VISRRLRVIGKQRDPDLRPRLAVREGLPITRNSHLGNEAFFGHLRASCERAGAGLSHSSGRANVSPCWSSPRQSSPPMNSDYYCRLWDRQGRKLRASGQRAPNAPAAKGLSSQLHCHSATSPGPRRWLRYFPSLLHDLSSSYPRDGTARVGAKRFKQARGDLSRLAGLYKFSIAANGENK
jgi:hypothetical protein